MKKMTKTELENRLAELKVAQKELLVLSTEPGLEFAKQLKKIIPYLNTPEFDKLSAESIVETFNKQTAFLDKMQQKINVEISRIEKELE